MGLKGIIVLTYGNGNYYTTDLAEELRIALDAQGRIRFEQNGPGHWVGAGAPALGLLGAVDQLDFEMVLTSTHPDLVQRNSGKNRTNLGYDLTFNAPKGVSVLFAFGGQKVAAQVLTAHEAAVAASLDYLERHACWVSSRSGGRNVPVPSLGFVGASFTHGLSRGLDPHLHTHVVLGNVTQRPTDGKWLALDSESLNAHRAMAGWLYDAELRRALSVELGVEWKLNGDRGAYEIDGIDEGILTAFSTRHTRAIDYIATNMLAEAESGRYTPEQLMKTALLRTRGPKLLELDMVDLADVADRWERLGEALDFGEEKIRQEVIGRNFTPERFLDEGAFSQRMLEVESLSKSKGKGDGFFQRQVLGAWAAALRSGGTVHEIEGCVEQLTNWREQNGAPGPHRREASYTRERFVLTESELNLLGPRPALPEEFEQWRKAYEMVRDYGARRPEVNDPARELGTIPSSELVRMTTGRLADRRRTARKLTEVLQRSGIKREGRELDGRELDGPELSL